jgi:ParB-like chromosome segregation protein Spo0J
MTQDPPSGRPSADDGLSTCSAPEWLPLRSLLPADSPRHAGENPEHIEMLSMVDAPLPPIIVHRRTMRVIDGMHRLAAARMRGDTKIQVRFFDGTNKEAFLLAVRSNIAHGLPLSYDDRSRAAKRIIKAHPGWSDRAIAAASGLGARTVGNIRRNLSRETRAAHLPARTGLDGRVRPLDHEEGRLRAYELLKQRPNASLREIAREIGVSPTTVRDVRQRIERGDGPVPDGRRNRAGKPARPPGDDKPSGHDATDKLQSLVNDPSLRGSDSGRSLVRWMLARAIRADEWLDIVGSVPPHSSYLIADLARSCAEEWRQLAEGLEKRGEAES